MGLNTKINTAKVLPTVLLIMIGLTLVVSGNAVWEMTKPLPPAVLQTEEMLSQEKATTTNVTEETIPVVEEETTPAIVKTETKPEVTTPDDPLKKLFPEDDVSYSFFIRVDQLVSKKTDTYVYRAAIIKNNIGFDVPLTLESKNELKINNPYKAKILHNSQTKVFTATEAYSMGQIGGYDE